MCHSAFVAVVVFLLHIADWDQRVTGWQKQKISYDGPFLFFTPKWLGMTTPDRHLELEIEILLKNLGLLSFSLKVWYWFCCSCKKEKKLGVIRTQPWAAATARTQIQRGMSLLASSYLRWRKTQPRPLSPILVAMNLTGVVRRRLPQPHTTLRRKKFWYVRYLLPNTCSTAKRTYQSRRKWQMPNL